MHPNRSQQQHADEFTVLEFDFARTIGPVLRNEIVADTLDTLAQQNPDKEIDDLIGDITDTNVLETQMGKTMQQYRTRHTVTFDEPLRTSSFCVEDGCMKRSISLILKEKGLLAIDSLCRDPQFSEHEPLPNEPFADIGRTVLRVAIATECVLGVSLAAVSWWMSSAVNPYGAGIFFGSACFAFKCAFLKFKQLSELKKPYRQNEY